jgi:hypothetical protein
VLTFPDYDLAGINAAARWHKQLAGIAAELKVFDYMGLLLNFVSA